MVAANPSTHVHSAADTLDRLVRDVRSGRAQWSHPQHARQTTDDLARVLTAAGTAIQEMTAALDRLDQTRGPRTRQATDSLHAAGQSATAAASQLRAARRLMH